MSQLRPPQSLCFLVALLFMAACGRQGGQASEGQEQVRGEVAAAEAEAGPPSSTVLPGIDVLLKDSLHLIQGHRLGLITNHTGLDAQGRSSIDRLAELPDADLVALFSPEHGIRGNKEGGVEIAGDFDERTGLPIHSLYGATRKPTPEMLQGIDLLLFDIQDVGARFYTYVSTMAMGMEAAGEQGLPFLVLDRPNPIGGNQVQGNVLDPAFSTFVGLFPIPTRHGMTPGELALLFRGEFGVEADVTVVPVQGWSGDLLFSDTDLPWVAPSPNMPSQESALHYPGTCLFEGTPLSVGRGTDFAFQVVGAPWLDGPELARALESYGFSGIRFEAIRFTPENPGDGKFGGQEIPGVRLVYLDDSYDPTVAALALIIETRRMSGEAWEWRESHFDRLAGTDRLRPGLEAGVSIEELTEGWQEALDAFRSLSEPYLLYPRSR